MVDRTDIDDEFIDEEVEAYHARCVHLGTHPKGYDFYLEPGVGSMRIIRCRRGGTYTQTPDSLQGGYTDAQTAMRAVANYLSQLGKPKPKPMAPEPGSVLAALQDAHAELVPGSEDKDEVDEEFQDTPPVIDLTDPNKAPPSDLEPSVTQAKRSPSARVQAKRK